MATRLVMNMLTNRLGMFLCGVLALVPGVILVLFANNPMHFVRVDGTVASYVTVANAAGSYDHNELRLADDPQIYKLDDGEYAPAPPHTIATGANVTIWLDQGHPWVYAMTIDDESGQPAHRYTTFPFDHPDQNLLYSHIGAGAFLGLGALLMLMSLLWRHLPWRRRRRRKPAYVPTYMAPGMFDGDQWSR